MPGVSTPATNTMKKLLLLLSLLFVAAPSHADDNIFPPSAAAKNFVDFDGRGFLINGQRTFIVSGSLHYPRVPRALWRDRLLRMKRGGFNCVQTYVFWNYHEPKQGQFDFSGEKDLDAFLKLVHQMGMYAVVRPGPYVCAEWDSGGYPVWLRFKPGLKVRQENAEFEKYVDRYMEKVMPIIAANQINRGGAVIMVQLENEHPQGWGRDMPNNYFKHLREKALQLGLEVPYFFSGLHHGSDPAGNNPWDSKGRTSPWYTTEFWPGWYDLYGPLDAANLRRFDRGTWKILAYGGNGYNYYMLHGGTNFDSWNDNEDASSYDYAGAIGQAGDLRPIYYRFKRAAWFARSFQEILENSENATSDYKDAATNPKIRVTARKSPAGTLIFLDNNTNEVQETRIKIDGVEYPVAKLAPGQILPVVKDFQLGNDMQIKICTQPLLGVVKQADITSIVAYGSPGKGGVLKIIGDKPEKITRTERVDGNGILVKDVSKSRETSKFDIEFDIPDNCCVLNSQMLKLHTLVMSEEMADRTWFVEKGKDTIAVMGVQFLGEFGSNGANFTATAERSAAPDKLFSQASFAAFSGQTIGHKFFRFEIPNNEVGFTAPTLENWQMRAAGEIAPSFNDADWLKSDTPLPMGADGDYGAHAWYRTTLKAPTAGDYDLRFSGAHDWMGAWVNGQRVEVTGKAGRTAKVTLKAGDNSLAVLTSHLGRPKLFNYLGAMDKVDAKGLTGAVTLTQGEVAPPNAANAVQWRWKSGTASDALAALDVKSNDWPEAKPGEDVFNHKTGAAWFRATLPELAGPNRTLHFESVDDKGTVYLNGQKLIEHEGWDEAFDVPLDAAWKAGGPNIVTVFVENGDGAGGISATSLQAAIPDKNAVYHWKMRGGVGNPEAGPWQPLGPINSAPTFYRASFTTTPPGETGAHPIWRVSLPGLSRGFVWLNGHNLGRYPEKLRVDGLYLPEPWIQRGANSLVIFDEEGNSPSNVKIVVEAAASRVSVALTAVK